MLVSHCLYLISENEGDIFSLMTCFNTLNISEDHNLKKGEDLNRNLKVVFPGNLDYAVSMSAMKKKMKGFIFIVVHTFNCYR